MEFHVSAIAIPISIVSAIILYRMIFVGEDENRLRREVEKEAQHQQGDGEAQSQTVARRQAERRRIEAELAVEKSKQAVARRQAERRQQEIKRAKRAALMANLLKSPVTMAAVVAILIRLPILRYKQHRLEVKKAKQAAAERQRLEAERAAQVAAQREAERQRIEAERAEQAAAQREAERQRREAERARKAALIAQQRKREEHWESLGGIQFERELGKLFRAQGYNVKSTPVSGDQGVDLILTKNGKITVVQCKAHKSPIGPSVARELFGSMHHFKADSAILACTGGFTDGVIKFARGKPIRLISAWDIARMAEVSGDGMHDMAESPPVCPKYGCGRTMVL